MKIFGLVAACLFAVLTVGTASAEFKRITNEADFRANVVGKTLWLDKSFFTIRRRGKLDGTFDGVKVKGVWEWRDGYWCRTLTEPRQNTDCQHWEQDGKNFRVTREKGKGRGFTYKRR